MNHQLYIARREAKIKQSDLAKMLGIHQVTYSRKESGSRDFTITEARMLSQIFNKSLDELFGGGDRDENVC